MKAADVQVADSRRAAGQHLQHDLKDRIPAWVKLQVDRKSTRLNSSHLVISYAVFCLKKKKQDAAPACNGSQQDGGSLVRAHDGSRLGTSPSILPPPEFLFSVHRRIRLLSALPAG